MKKSSRNSDSRASRIQSSQTKTVAQNLSEDLAGRCAERHTHADFPQALRDRVRQHPIDTEARENKRQKPSCTQQDTADIFTQHRRTS